MSKRKKVRFTINRFKTPQAPSSATKPAKPISVGPVTPGPANKILLNAIENGLTDQTILLPGENGELLRTLAGSFIATYQPANDAEFLIVEEMVVAKWRLRRSWGAENCLIQSEISVQSAKINSQFESPKPDLIQTLALRELTDSSKLLAYLNRQQLRFTREYDRALTQLRIHQTLRKEEESASTVELQHTPKDPAPAPPSTANETKGQSLEKEKFQNNPNASQYYPHPKLPTANGLDSPHVASTPEDAAPSQK